jgi:outer membrane protein OmpA-like peptidoglycan-associated protein
MFKLLTLAAFNASLFTASLAGQVPNPTQSQTPQYVGATPVFRVTATARTIKAINFNHREGSTSVNLVGTGLMPRAKGEAHVDSKTGATKVDVSFSKMEPAQVHGDSFLTYVLWAITPEGRPENLGEVFLNGETTRLQASTELQAFGLIVTAEPYFAVTQPSDTVVMEGIVKEGPEGTTGTIAPIEAKYELLEHGSYDSVLPAADRAIFKQKNDAPLDLKEARQAMAIARGVGAPQYAGDTMQKAAVDLGNAEAFWSSRKDTKRVQTLARNVTQLAEDARIITLRKRQEEDLAAERRLDEQKVAAAKSDAEREASQRALAETERRQALEREREAREQAEQEARLRQRAETQQALLAQARADAETMLASARVDKAKAEADAKAARDAAAGLEARNEKTEQERLALRIQLREQLNKVLQTQDSARGLIVNMSDVLFDFGLYSLKPGAREKLAKISGILLAHPELTVQVEGHTDSIGSEDFNQTLSEHRAGAVRDFLVDQGVIRDSVTAKGFGKTKPVATNDTAEGRQRNRRVELIVAGESIQTSSAP